MTLGKRGDLHARRMASVHVRDRDLLKKLFDELGPRLLSGLVVTHEFLSLVTVSDNGLMSLIEFVDKGQPAPQLSEAATEA